jgi:DNA-binding transcriptional ArsR family regulator
LVSDNKHRRSRRGSRNGVFVQSEQFVRTACGLSDRGKRILELLGAGRPPSVVAEAIGINRSSMSRWVKKLRRLGFIRLLPQSVKGSWNFYELTEEGSKFLTGSEEDRLVIVLEDYPVKFEVVSWGRADCLAWEKLGEPRNWVKLGFKVGGVRVVRTSRSVIVHPGRLRGDNSWNLVFVASRECDRVARWLAQRVDMVLRPGEPVKRPTFQVYDQLAEMVTSSFSFKNQDGEGADRSPPARKGHWELGPEAANDFIRASSRLKQLTRQLYQLEGDLGKLEDGLLPALDAWTKVGKQLLKILEKLGQMEEAPSQSMKDESGRYIS